MSAAALSTTVGQTLPLGAAGDDNASLFTSRLFFFFFDAVLFDALLNGAARDLAASVMTAPTLDAGIKDSVPKHRAAVSAARPVFFSLLFAFGRLRPLRPLRSLRSLCLLFALRSLWPRSLFGSLSDLTVLAGVSIKLNAASALLSRQLEVAASLNGLGEVVHTSTA